MELRHFRYFVALAEELHFAQAAKKLHIEQSPLSRAIKELEYDLGVRLFERTTRSTRLTWAGRVLLDNVRRVFATIDQAKASAKAAASGYRGTLRIALSDDLPHARLAALLAQCRRDEPEVEIRLFETSLGQQIKGLRSDLFDAGLAQCAEVGEDIVALPVWNDALRVVVPARHPLLAYKQVPLDEVLRHPLILGHPELCEGSRRQIEQLIRALGTRPVEVEHTATHELMLTLVAAGYGLGFASAAQVELHRFSDVVARPLAGNAMAMTTYFLRPNVEPFSQLSQFMARLCPSEEREPV